MKMPPSAAPPSAAPPSAAPPSARRAIRPPDPEAVARVVDAALAEDLVRGDPTSEGLFGPDQPCAAVLLLKEPGVVCGLDIAAAVFAALDGRVRLEASHADGDRVEAVPAELARITGPARAILAGERTALNLMGGLSGVATFTARCVARLAGTGVTLLDTRKTTPGLRELEKYAVRCGGGANHRLNLGQALLVKDSHKRLAGGVAEAADRLRQTHPHLTLQVEVETLAEVRAALEAGIHFLLLDNMSPAQLRKAVKMCAGGAKTEASGGITEANLRAVAETGVDFISLGALTHSARSIDLSLEVVV